MSREVHNGAGQSPPAGDGPDDVARAETAFPNEPQEPTSWVGRTLDGRYRILRPLAQGGMGAVFVAEHLSLRKEVALKVIRPEFSENAEIAVRFAREAIAMAQFEHPHVASAIDYGTLPEGGAYLVMQLVRGESLRQVMRAQKRLPWRRACAIGAQAADALSAARARGIVHRDLKPDNLLVESREDGSDLIKILDFGIARMDGNPDGPDAALPGHALTRVGMVMGTPGYMAPEQAVGDQLDHRADLYALGVVLWEGITGKDLWTGEDITAIIAMQMREDAPLLRDVVNDPTLPEELEELLQQLLARNAAERPNHPGDVRDALRALSLSATGEWGPVLTRPGTQMALPTLGTGVGPVSGWLGQTLAPYPKLQRAGLKAISELQTAPRALLGAVAAAAALLFWLLISTGEPVQEPTVVPAPGVTDGTAAIGPQKPPAGRASSPNKQVSTDKSVLLKVVEAAGRAVEPALNAVTEAAEPPLPEALKGPVSDMLEGKRLRTRRTAAGLVLEHEPRAAVPAYLIPIADFESTSRCGERRAALEEMVRIGDVRARPIVERYHDSPPSGCGFLGLSDCYRCIRSDLRKALEDLPAAP